MKTIKFVVRLNRGGRAAEYVQRIDPAPIHMTTNPKLALLMGRLTAEDAIESLDVYVGSSDYNVYALNASTGAKLWSYATGNGVDSSPAVVNGVVYVGSEDGNLYALDARGCEWSGVRQHLVWRPLCAGCQHWRPVVV